MRRPLLYSSSAYWGTSRNRNGQSKGFLEVLLGCLRVPFLLEINDIWHLRRVLGDSWGAFEVGRVRKTPGRGREVPGSFRAGSWRGPRNPSFFFRGEFVTGLMNYWCFQFWGGFVTRLVVISLWYFFSFFETSTFAKQWREYVIKSMVFVAIPIWNLQIAMKTYCLEHEFGRCMFRPRSINFEGNR